jgi:organic hydroperoxide reductase OsmC/OhrA
MSEHIVEIIWQRGDQMFTDRHYSRKHLLKFDGGLEVPGSSSPSIVPLPYSDATAADPEELLLAALSNCHMLWFLDLAARAGFVVDTYKDKASGVMGKNAKGKIFLAKAKLNPVTAFSGEKIPTQEELAELHHRAHEECFIANSVLTDISCEPVLA